MRGAHAFRRLAPLVAAGALVAVLVPACGHDRLRTTLLENQRPTVTMTHAPSATGSPAFYAYEIRWTGSDPDGSVDHYVYCVDPPTPARADTPWISTTANRQLFTFACNDPDSAGTRARPGGYHVVAIKAVDDRGACSAPAVAAFFTFTVAPTVTFLAPKRTSALIDPQLPPTTTFEWTGFDPDGPTRRPAYYRYRRFMKTDREFDYLTLQLYPDSLRKRYGPDFASWDSIAGDTCRVMARAMTPGAVGVMAVVAFDEAGAYTPVFSYDGNLLRFICANPNLMGPRMTVWNDYFTYSYASGGYNTDPTSFLSLEVAGGRTAEFKWSATAASGSTLLGFRWAMDLESIDDPTPRADENTDWRHWSRLGAANTRAIVGPFAGTGADSLEQHTLYIEAEDLNHLRSLAAVRFRVLRNTGIRPLLFVDDTRMTPDRTSYGNPDSVAAPSGVWPSAAELDTFLFAIGGVRWRDYVPATAQSAPGIFKGYDFDTIGTRGLSGGALPLAALAPYRAVVWYCNDAEEYRSTIDNTRTPMTLMRAMCAPARANPLVAYCEMGGATWLMGGGIAYNSLYNWNVTTNDLNPFYDHSRKGRIFTAAAGELVAGRLMFHTAHWRSQIQLIDGGRLTRHPRNVNWPGGPDYGLMPPELREKTIQTDPMPLMRSLPNQFYGPVAPTEILNRPNVVTGLDTLYRSASYDSCVTMTFYHGPESGPCVFTGFPIWFPQRAQAIRLADFVLQNLLGFPRRPEPR